MNRKKNIQAIYPLSPMQQGMLFHSLYAPESGVYFEQLTCTLTGNIDLEAFQKAWQLVVDRHDVLRTGFVWQQIDKMLQVVHKKVAVQVDYQDWRGHSAEELSRKWQRYLQSERHRGFELSRAPLMRLGLIHVADDTYRFAWHHHHLLLDGWSLPIVLTDLITHYAALCQNQPIKLPPARPYKQYIDWLNEQDETAVGHYWQDRLKGFVAPTPLIVDQAIVQPPTPYGELEIHLSAETTAKLDALARHNNLTLSTIVQAAWALLLQRYSGENDVVFGSTVSGRSANIPGIEQMVGLFINTLPIRTNIPNEMPVLDWLKQLQAQLVQMRQYEFAALSQIQAWSEVPRDLPLFNSIFVFENYPVSALVRQDSAPFAFSDVKGFEQTNYPLTIVSAPGPELLLRIAYDGHRFDEATVLRILGHLRVLLTGIAANPTQPIRTLPLLTEAEQQQILVEWNSTQVDFPANKTVTRLFEEQVARTPGATAVSFENQSLTYAQLDSRVNQLAHHLQEQGIAPDTLVGLCLEPSLEMIGGVLGILKAGGAYLPLDPAYPAERLAFMLEDAQPKLVLTQQSLVGQIRLASPALTLDTNWPAIAQQPTTQPVCPAAAENLAYVIYTSGSTGRPKGTLLFHRGLINFALANARDLEVGPGSRLLQFASLSFDASVAEIFTALLAGATLCLAPRETLSSIPDLTRFVQEQAITTATLPPAVWALLDPASWPTLQSAISAGEACPPQVAQRWAPGHRFFNAYGPTETSIGVTCYRVPEEEKWETAVPIGKAIANTQLYILDQAGRPVPVGVPGELHIGGVGVAKGYLNRPELTAERFIQLSVVSKQYSVGGAEKLYADNWPLNTVYKTGDLCRFLPDGNIEFLGRIDQQVKVRGFRIELGEIEAVLQEHEAVRETAVLAQADPQGQNQLVAYLTTVEEVEPTTEAVRDFLGQKLPHYMIPAAFVLLEAMPRLPNGKINREGLPNLDGSRLERGVPYAPPRLPAEEIVAGVWSHFLKLERVGINDNFYELGGHSLLATQILSRIRRIFKIDLPLRTLLDNPTISDLVLAIQEAGQTAVTTPDMPLEPAPRKDPLPLSFAQQRIWFLEQLEPDNLFYNIPSAIRLTGKLDKTALERSVNEIVRRHEALRTVFTAEGGTPRQKILPELILPLPVEDLQNLPAAEREVEARQRITAEVQRPFDLATGPLLRMRLLKLGPGEHIAILAMHHIISDGWSMRLFINELAVLYQAFTADQASPLPDLPLHYADFALWQQQWLQGATRQQQLAYWKAQLEDRPLMLNLPTDHPRPAVQSWRGAVEAFDLPPELAQALQLFSQQEGVTLFMTLLAAFQLLLYRYTGQTDISVGTAVANRNRAEIEGLIGFFVNTLVMRTDLSGQPNFRKLLQRVREVALGAYAHQDLPFEMLVEALQPDRDLSHTPLFQVAFALQNQTAESVQLPGLAWTPLPAESGTAKFDLTLEMAPHGDGLRGYLEYNSDLFEPATIQRLAGHFQTVLAGIVATPDLPVSQLPLLSPAEQQQLLVDWNDTAVPFPHTSCSHQLFEAWAHKQPETVALTFAGTALTYGQLNRRANQLAHFLQKQGVGPEVLVGIATERSLEMVVAILAVLKAGGAYLPLDPTYPAERLDFMIQDSQITLLLTQEHLLSQLPEVDIRIVCLDADGEQFAGESERGVETAVSAANLSYVIYTSGSTGQPKGAMLAHQGLCNLALAQRRAFHIRPGHSRILQFSPLSFDASVWETFMALANGATLVLARQETLASPQELARLLQDQQVTNVTLPPSVLAVLPPQPLPQLETIIAAGEACPAELVQTWAPGRAFFNAYGPTETTVCAAMYRCDAADAGHPPIGRPLDNFQLFVLDANRQPVPLGVPGELHVAGVGLARGYLNRPELTAERFVRLALDGNPTTVYRTGDVVRYRADGNLEFLGRLDHQVKVRGFRIELAEIESVLRHHVAVQEAVVVAQEEAAEGGQTDKRLVAYVVSTAADEPSVSELRAHLRRSLPEYMVPNLFVWLDALPTSPSGKIDRSALPAPDKSRPALERAFVPPRSETEAALAKIWTSLLEVEQVGVFDNFFELGGHSLLATQLMSRLHDQLHVDLPVKALFETPNVAGLAKQIDIANKLDRDKLDRIENLLAEVNQLSEEEVKVLLTQKRAFYQKRAF